MNKLKNILIVMLLAGFFVFGCFLIESGVKKIFKEIHDGGGLKTAVEHVWSRP